MDKIVRFNILGRVATEIQKSFPDFCFKINSRDRVSTERETEKYRVIGGNRKTENEKEINTESETQSER